MFIGRFFAILALGLSLSHGVFAKELSSRLGVGFRSANSIDLPSIAASYFPSSDWGLIGSLGVDTKDLNSSFAFGVGLRKIIFKEDNMNFFMGGNLSLLSQEIAGSASSGFELSAVVGSEFFITGLDSLGFNFETGVGVTNLNKVRFRTLADNFFRAGMFFYF